jgi:Zn-dependent peptidase ImmA (M78 family)
VRVLTEDDFQQYCDQAGIIVRDAQLKKRAMYIWPDGGRPRIFINQNLRGSDRLFVCFHELAHYWLHPHRVRYFSGMKSQVEAEANIVAICAMIPLTVLKNYWKTEIVEIYGCTLDQVEFRETVYKCWKI